MPIYNFEKQTDGSVRSFVDGAYKRTFIGASLVEVVDNDSFDIIDSIGGRHRYELTQNGTPNTFELAGSDITGTVEEICQELDTVFPKANSSSGGTGAIGGPYANNAEAVAALGVGKLYKSTTLVNGSPIILITQ